MARTTRGGAQFSPYEPDFLDRLGPLENVKTFRARVSLEPFIRDAIIAADRRAAALEADPSAEDDEWEDEEPVLSRPPTPLSRPPTPMSPAPMSHTPPPSSPVPSPSSRSSSRSSSPLSSPPPTPPPHRPSELPTYKQRQAQGKVARRKRKRTAEAQGSMFGRPPQAKTSQAYRQQQPHRTTFVVSSLGSSSNGGWRAARPPKKRRLTDQLCLGKLLAAGHELVEWDGRAPLLILDADGRIVAVLLGRPEGEDWDEVIADVASLLEKIRASGLQQGVFKAQHRPHRRGDFHTLNGGVTKGPGQLKPGNIAHSKKYRRLLEHVRLSRSVRRIMGFQSSGFASYLPKLYEDYVKTMKGLYTHQPELEQLFDNSVFPAATWNLGPNVVTALHTDTLNVPFGICPITSAGRYDHKLGGHLCLKQLKLVIQFPSGATSIILSAAVEHGNTPIQAGETRYSMTQYAAGELFRWAAYGYQTTKSLLATPGGAEKKRNFDGEPGARAARAMSLLSKISELQADREVVFGGRW